MSVGYKQLLAEAEAEVTSLTTDQAADRLDDPDLIFVDIRDPRELDREGMIPNAKHAPRGMLEFWIDPDSPYHKDWFATDKTYLFYCASGWRSLLAAQVAQRMGLKTASLLGGFGDWKRAEKPQAMRAPR